MMIKGSTNINDDFEMTGSLGDFCDSVEWLIYESKNNKHEWRMIRLVAQGKAPHKANYWLSYNGQRFAENKDLKLLRGNRPALFKQLAQAIGCNNN